MELLCYHQIMSKCSVASRLHVRVTGLNLRNSIGLVDGSYPESAARGREWERCVFRRRRVFHRLLYYSCNTGMLSIEMLPLLFWHSNYYTKYTSLHIPIGNALSCIISVVCITFSLWNILPISHFFLFAWWTVNRLFITDAISGSASLDRSVGFMALFQCFYFSFFFLVRKLYFFYKKLYYFIMLP